MPDEKDSVPPARKPPRAVVLQGVDVLHNEQTPPRSKGMGLPFVPSTILNTSPRTDTPTGSPQTSATPSTGSPSTLDHILQATEVVCVSYIDEYSVDNDSLNDLHIGCTHRVVSSNQDVLDRATNGSLAIVTTQRRTKRDRYFVIGVLGDHTGRCTVWSSRGGHVFKYTRIFTPLTDVLPMASIADKWATNCEDLAVSKDPKNLFNSRLCGYGECYVSALQSALTLGFIPLTTSKGTHIFFE